MAKPSVIRSVCGRCGAEFEFVPELENEVGSCPLCGKEIRFVGSPVVPTAQPAPTKPPTRQQVNSTAALDVSGLSPEQSKVKRRESTTSAGLDIGPMWETALREAFANIRGDAAKKLLPELQRRTGLGYARTAKLLGLDPETDVADALRQTQDIAAARSPEVREKLLAELQDSAKLDNTVEKPKPGDICEGIQLDGDSLTIRKPEFCGTGSRSPNGRFIIGWMPITASSGNIEAFYLLLDNSRIVAAGTIRDGYASPRALKVANNGDFILNEDNEQVFYAFSSTGEILVQRVAPGGTGANGISEDGRYAFCDGLVCSDEDDACGDENPNEPGLCLFDLETRKLLVKFCPARDSADACEFEPENKILRLIYNDGLVLRYGFDGALLDEEKWESVKVNYLRGDGLLNLAKEKLAGIQGKDVGSFAEVMSLLHDALIKADSESTRAAIHQQLSTIYGWCQDSRKAQQHLENGLKFMSGCQVLAIAVGRLEDVRETDLGSFSEVIALFERALLKGVSVYTQAKIHRHLGEIYDGCNDKAEALEHFETALELNPQIGVKKAIARLKGPAQGD